MIGNDWDIILKEEFEKKYFKDLIAKVEKEYITKTVFPKKKDLFRAFRLTPFNKVKVVIIGQDPYHEIGQANGLAFSVNNGVKFPPSLKNIFKELENDLAISRNSSDLSDWSSQGILLMNSIMTVIEGKANSHKNIGWEQFTDNIIKYISDLKSNVVFILWGNYSIKKSGLIDKSKHLIISSAHPSPLSCYRGFFDSKCFSRVNDYLKMTNQTEIDW